MYLNTVRSAFGFVLSLYCTTAAMGHGLFSVVGTKQIAFKVASANA